MKIMTATRPTTLVFLIVALELLASLGFPHTAVAVGDAEQASSPAMNDASPVPRRSHIQPVSEIAAAVRHEDTLGLRLARASEVLRQQLALARGAGLVVEEVTPGSAADKAGFRQHDVLVLLDDQMLLLPEQLSALLEAANGTATSQCTLLRGGAKVTIALGEPRAETQPSLAASSKASGQIPASPTFAPQPVRPTQHIVRQTAAKPSTNPRLRAPASALALVQPDKQGRTDASAVQTSANVPAESPGHETGRMASPADETLVRHDPDFQIKLSRVFRDKPGQNQAGQFKIGTKTGGMRSHESKGEEKRLVVLDPQGRIIFNDAIDTPEKRGLIPIAVRQRVEEMETSLESVTGGSAIEIGRLDAPPIEIR